MYFTYSQFRHLEEPTMAVDRNANVEADKLRRQVKLLKALGNPVRLTILRTRYALGSRKIPASELLRIVNIQLEKPLSLPQFGQPLHILKKAGLIQDMKEGRRHYYSLTDTTLSILPGILNTLDQV